MDHQNFHRPNSEMQPSLPSQNEPSYETEEVSNTDAVSAEPQPQERRRRRLRVEDSRSALRGSKNASRGYRSKGKNRLTLEQKSKRLVLWGGVFFTVIIVFLGGFYAGQQFALHSEKVEKVVQQDAAFPLPETDTQLDAGFEAFQKGSYREAMLNFQHVLDRQPALVGLDYLIAESAYMAGEKSLAKEAAGHALVKNESVEEAHTLLALIDVADAASTEGDAQQISDPKTIAESAIKQLIASHLAEAKGYGLWGDFLRSNGSYRSAADVLHKGALRADLDSSQEVLSAKEQLARLQDTPAATVPSLSELTSMGGEQALVAALAALQKNQDEDAASFLERARDLYSPQVFQKLMKDVAFADYRKNPQIKQFFDEQ